MKVMCDVRYNILHVTCYLGMAVGNEGCNCNAKSHQKVHAFLEAHKLQGSYQLDFSDSKNLKKGKFKTEHVF